MCAYIVVGIVNSKNTFQSYDPVLTKLGGGVGHGPETITSISIFIPLLTNNDCNLEQIQILLNATVSH